MTIDDDTLNDLIDNFRTFDNSIDGSDRGKAYRRPSVYKMKRELLRTILVQVFRRRKIEIAENLKAGQVLELIALVISKTYAECGDSFQIADDDALMKIRELLVQHDPFIVKRYVYVKTSQQCLLKRFRDCRE